MRAGPGISMPRATVRPVVPAMGGRSTFPVNAQVSRDAANRHAADFVDDAAGQFFWYFGQRIVAVALDFADALARNAGAFGNGGHNVIRCDLLVAADRYAQTHTAFL